MDLDLALGLLRDVLLVVSTIGLVWASFGLLREVMGALEDEREN